ncbi:MAG: glycosyltransferase family 39 protein [Chloroflexaceae bacterium]|nr:glycosyltransferase family 39 protein [Chloroflexaceae bacterium]
MIRTNTRPASAEPMQVTASRYTLRGSLHLVALGLILLLAALLRCANLEALGYANHYYTAGVASMLQSWQNFFFVAAEPGGSVSIDKPPVGLWLQAISASLFGLNGVAVLLPQIIAGILSVCVLYHLVKRTYGVPAGLLAALVLAITPIVVATDRNNTIDSTLILTLLLASWAFLKATEQGMLRYLLLGVALAGIGFNIKMLQAYLPLPAFYGLYLLGAKTPLWRKLANLALATVLLLAVSLSWAIAVDLTPADQRPYVGSSGNNSVITLMLGYNGINRLVGMEGHGNQPEGSFDDDDGRDDQMATPSQADANDGAFQPGPGAPPMNANGGPGAPEGPGGPGGGFPGTGQAGPLRLFTTPLSKEMSWLLPFGLFSIGLLTFRSRLRWPITAQHQAVVLWGGWLVTGVVFFSIAGFFHEYYLSSLAAPLAALVAIGAIELWRLRGEHPRLATRLLLLATSVTLGLQLLTAYAFVGDAWWLAINGVLFASGAVLLLITVKRPLSSTVAIGFVTVIAALLILPSIWSALTTINASANQSLPSAYSGQISGPANEGDVQVNQELIDYLGEHTQDTKYLMAVPSSHEGADYVLAMNRPVLYLGGFMGQDEVASGADLSDMVAAGELRYIYWRANTSESEANPMAMGPGGGNAEITTWVATSCVAVEGFTAESENQFSILPDGAAADDGRADDGRADGGMPPGRGQALTLYDCGG